MKFKTKWSEILLRTALVIAVFISIVLSAYIWTSDQRFAHIEPQADRTTSLKGRDIKSLHDIYMPTQVFRFRDDQLYQVYDVNKNLPLEFSKEIEAADLSHPVKIAGGRKRYQRFLTNHDLLQLVYPDQLSFAIFYGDLTRDKSVVFNRIFIPVKTKQTFYLGDDLHDRLYRVKASKLSFDRLMRYSAKSTGQIPVRLEWLRDGYVPFYGKSQKVNVYSYLVNQQPNSYFVSRLLGTSGITKRVERNSTTYTAGIYERVTVPKNGSSFEYTNYSINKIPKTLTNRLYDSLTYVHQIGLMEQDLRFFDTNGSSVTYRHFVEGFPVFMSPQQNAQIRIAYNANGMTINFNSIDLQIPIPFDGQTTSLPATRTVISDLETEGIAPSDIQLLTIGYRVKYDNTYHRLINLIPTYYIKIFNHWKSLAEWQSTDITALKMVAKE